MLALSFALFGLWLLNAFCGACRLTLGWGGVISFVALLLVITYSGVEVQGNFCFMFLIAF